MDNKTKYPAGRNMKRYFWASALALLTLGGCATIDDNTDNCFPLAKLRFEYIHNIPELDFFREQVESIDLYVYNQSDDALAATKRFTQADLIKEDYCVALKWLRKGDYYIIAYGNKDDKYYECGEHRYMPDARVKMLCSDGNGTVTENPCHFFYGFTELSKTDNQEKVVSMIKDTNDIIITINNKVTRAWEEGLPDLTVKIAFPDPNGNGTIKYDNSIDAADTRTMTHISANSFEQYATSLRTTVRVGRLFETDGSTMKITGTNTGTEFVAIDLTKTIKATYEGANGTLPINEYLDRQDKYEFVYDLEMKYGVLVTTLISVNGWNAVENPIGGI